MGEAKENLAADDFYALAERADAARPRAEDVKALRQALRERPELWRAAGDLLGTAIKRAVASLNSTTLVKEVMEARCEQLRAELAGEGAGELEKLLAAQAALCYLRLAVCEQRYDEATSGEHSIAAGLYWEKRLTAAHRRYEGSLVALARVRRLLRPARPINVAIVNAACAAEGAEQQMKRVNARRLPE
jgi:hypothetical protein